MDTIAATNQFSHAPGIELANIVFAVLFASFFFLRHRQKYDAILIAVVGVMVGITVIFQEQLLQPQYQTQQRLLKIYLLLHLHILKTLG